MNQPSVNQAQSIVSTRNQGIRVLMLGLVGLGCVAQDTAIVLLSVMWWPLEAINRFRFTAGN